MTDGEFASSRGRQVIHPRYGEAVVPLQVTPWVDQETNESLVALSFSGELQVVSLKELELVPN